MVGTEDRGIRVGQSKEYRARELSKNLQKYLKEKNYAVADMLGSRKPNEEDLSFTIQDIEKCCKTGWIFKETVACEIGHAHIGEDIIRIKVYGREYLERFQRDLEEFKGKVSISEIELILDKENPNTIYPDRGIDIY